MTDNETLRELFPRNDRRGNYILVPIDKYEELISKAAALEDIRAEIRRNIIDTGDIGEADGYYKALNIIDRHIGKEEEDADS